MESPTPWTEKLPIIDIRIYRRATDDHRPYGPVLCEVQRSNGKWEDIPYRLLNVTTGTYIQPASDDSYFT